ncbi:type IV toxin-antitoxin system AbiEi family antitoxin domain-containing protein [Kribbella sp. NPDC049174]|uniref:type IV toxin-antitoxin system AbiEi family antitoxin domain-containing protein n=1 Tax=Kribbella sp. NPDC049174 TaxID=3364112 RepID=UPI003714B572
MPAVLDLADLSAEQWGLLTTAQARTVGVSPQALARLTNQGALERMTHGVYRVTGAPPSPLDDLRAAWLALDPARRAGERLRDQAPVVVSHRSAAAIHMLGDLEADEYEFTSSERRQTRRLGVRIHRGWLAPEEWTVVDGLPVTTVVRTVSDLAAAHVDGGHLARVVRDALTRQQVDDQQLATALRQHAHQYGARMGDGEALLARFLQESGVSVPIGRAVELAGGRSLRTAVETPKTSGDMQGLHDQLAAIQSAIAPFAQMSEQIRNPPAIKAVADLARQLQSPAIQRLAKQYSEIAELSQLARTISESIEAPDVGPAAQEDSA